MYSCLPPPITSVAATANPLYPTMAAPGCPLPFNCTQTGNNILCVTGSPRCVYSGQTLDQGNSWLWNVSSFGTNVCSSTTVTSTGQAPWQTQPCYTPYPP